MTKVLTFGTFDGIHEGHREMLREAKSCCHAGLDPASTKKLDSGSAGRNDKMCYLIVAVAPDNVVKEIKGVMTNHNSAKRIELLRKEGLADEVVVGDAEMHTWKIVKKYKPNVIALGYDQQELRTALEEYLERSYPDIETDEGFQTNPKKPKIVVLQAHQPAKYKSSLLK